MKFTKKSVYSALLILMAFFAMQGSWGHCSSGDNTKTSSEILEEPDPSLLVGHWKLQGDCWDYSGKGNHGINHGVDLQSNTDAAMFDGSSYIEVPHSASLQLGNRDFLITAWVKCEAGMTNGDIVNKYDQAQRRGLNLHVSGSSPGYSSISDVRNVHFGIDNAVEGAWEDCGKPWPSNSLISTLTVYQGNLYTGIADAADPQDACHVFRYEGGTNWTDCGRVGDDLTIPSVMGMVVHKGELYASTGAWMYWVMEPEEQAKMGPVHVYRYEGGTTWHDCGAIGAGHRIMSLASFAGNLYATDDAGDVWRYDGDYNWAFAGEVYWTGNRINATMVYRNKLYGGSSSWIHRYDDVNGAWPSVGTWDRFTVNQVHTMAIYGGSLYAGTWPLGRILRYNSDNDWTACGDLGISAEEKVRDINEVNDLTVYNGKLYAGVIPKGEVWRYEGGEEWTKLKQLAVNPNFVQWGDDYSWRRVPAMTIFQGRMYCGTSNLAGQSEPEQPGNDIGKVFAYEAGKSVSYGNDLETVWRHVAAERKGSYLKLYIDRELVATSSAFDSTKFNISNDNAFLIGFGLENYFNGSMKDVRLYRAKPEKTAFPWLQLLLGD